MADETPAEPTEDAEAARQKRQLRLLGGGFVASGAITLLLANGEDPAGTLVFLLGFVGFAGIVLERLQGVTPGFSFGLVTGGIAVWAWPFLSPTTATDYAYLGSLMVGVGLVNVVLAPIGLWFRRLGERLGEKTK
ncbi:hypothetical protein [Natronomonas sp. EA1]|uniref:hypothetical protein n=1 Tax=Natronomonas sp. EA1 TaxID=3421655 RepID=UPI003EBA077C